MRDLHNNVKVTNALNNGAVTNSVVNGVIIDTQGFQSLEFAIKSEAVTDGAHAPSLTAGDDPALADGTAVAAGDLLGTVAGATFAAADDNTVKKIGYRGLKRYVRLSMQGTGATTGGVFSAVAIQGHPVSMPAA